MGSCFSVISNERKIPSVQIHKKSKKYLYGGKAKKRRYLRKKSFIRKGRRNSSRTTQI